MSDRKPDDLRTKLSAMYRELSPQGREKLTREVNKILLARELVSSKPKEGG